MKICNCSIKTGRFPDTWKVARVTPIHKKDSGDDISNYRPISILPIASKILEKHVSIHLYEYMTSYNLLHQKQSGFRANHSCETALTLMVDTWLSALNRCNEIGLLLVDLCKAFDLVDHNILIKKLKLYKCSSVALNWFEFYLRNRKQFVVINGTKSNPLNIKSGVPQGSILGPLLFIIFINDISLEKYLSDINLFADDAVESVEHKTKDKIIKKLQECAVSLYRWCLQNKMVLSIEKTKTLFISNREKSVQINTNCNLANVKIGNTVIDEVNSTKLLGVNIDNTLSWTMQVAQVKKCTSYRLFLFRTIRKYLPLETRTKYYDYYVKPLIEYCSSVWGICSKENQTKIIKIQKKAARLILEAPPLTPSKQTFQQLKWLPFNEIVKFKQVSLVYKAVNGNAPQYIQTMFTNIKDNSNYSLRSSANKKLFVSRTHHKSLSYTGVIIWNALPENIKSSKTFTKFKNLYIKKTLEENKYR